MLKRYNVETFAAVFLPPVDIEYHHSRQGVHMWIDAHSSISASFVHDWDREGLVVR